MTFYGSAQTSIIPVIVVFIYNGHRVECLTPLKDRGFVFISGFAAVIVWRMMPPVTEKQEPNCF